MGLWAPSRVVVVGTHRAGGAYGLGCPVGLWAPLGLRVPVVLWVPCRAVGTHGAVSALQGCSYL